MDPRLPFTNSLQRTLGQRCIRWLVLRLSMATALGVGCTGSIAQNSALPVGTKFLVASCLDQTRQGSQGPYRTQQAAVWVAVPPEISAYIATMPGGEKTVPLSDPPFSRIATIASESIRHAGDRCGYAYPRRQQTPGDATTLIMLFKDSLPAGGAFRPDERAAVVRPEDSAAVVLSMSTFNGATFTFRSHLDATTQAQQKSSDEAKRRSEAARVAAKEEEVRRTAFFAKHGVGGFVDARALATNPFAMEGKAVVMRARLMEMISATKAVVVIEGSLPVVVSDVTRGAFGTEGMYIVVGKVIGKANFEGNVLGPVPHVKFVEVVRCVQNACFSRT